MTNYFDLHCHLLPDVDDGPATMADALALAQALVQQGFRTWERPPISRIFPALFGTVMQHQLLCEGQELSSVALGRNFMTSVVLAPHRDVVRRYQSPLLELPFKVAVHTEQVLFSGRAGCHEPTGTLKVPVVRPKTLVQLDALRVTSPVPTCKRANGMPSSYNR